MNLLTSHVIASRILSLSESELKLLLNDIRERSLQGEFDEQRHISQDIIERLRSAGLYRTLAPRRFGGNEATAAEFCQLIECISEADGSTGWVSSFGMSPVYLSSLPMDTLKTLYSGEHGANLIFAGGIFPPQPATLVPGGLKVSGRWQYSSGCMGADIVGVGILPESEGKRDLPRIAVMPKSRVRIEQTWNTTGLAGTGSHDLVIEDVVVSEEWTFIRGSHSSFDEPLFRYPSLAFATQVLSVVSLGIARRAINEVRNLAGQSRSVTGAPPLSQRPVALIEIAKAEARLRSVRNFFYDAIHEAWEGVIAGEDIQTEQINMLRLSSTNAVREAAKICRSMQLLIGMAGVSRTNAVARCVSDALVITQHAFMGDVTYQNAGSILCGQEPFPGYL